MFKFEIEIDIIYIFYIHSIIDSNTIYTLRVYYKVYTVHLYKMCNEYFRYLTIYFLEVGSSPIVNSQDLRVISDTI